MITVCGSISASRETMTLEIEWAEEAGDRGGITGLREK